MNPTISQFCPQCKKYGRVHLKPQEEIHCPHCQTLWGKVDDLTTISEQCPICQCRQFYTDKDFNQVIGFGIMGIGIILVPMTYGLSLPVMALIDWIIYKKVPLLMACYKCGSEFRDTIIPLHLKPFMHHIGLKYDKFR